MDIPKEELKTLLETPLDPNLNYFDATASIEAMAEHIRGLHKLINVMFESLALQGSAAIRNSEAIVEIKADLLAAGIEVSKKEPQSSIIMPGKAKLELN